MSYSRLEKFIYAICSMDVTDLPVPLSRIEKLWNCLITGETPDFEPLSRNEKYLMAMLDRYDISNLPAPMSRGEKLLYKIAVGETDLSDVPGYLSRYEELLKYLIENGGISGGDFEYVLYTLNQSLYTLYTTAEKPVKKAIIYGDTLVNTLQESSSLAVTPMDEEINAQQATVTGTANGTIQRAILTGSTKYRDISSNKIYDSYETATQGWSTNKYKLWCSQDSGATSELNGTIVSGADIVTLDFHAINHSTYKLTGNCTYKKVVFYDNNQTFISSTVTTTTTDDLVINNIPSNARYVRFSFFPYEDNTGSCSIVDESNNPINLRQIQLISCKMPVLTTTGKNLFDKTNIIDGYIAYDGFHESTKGYITIDWFYCKPNTTYTVSGVNRNKWLLCNANGEETYIGGSTGNETPTITTNSDTIKFRCYISTYNISIDLDQVQLEEGSSATTYEPYKSNILSTPEVLELRGIGDVKDTLDCLTGEIVSNFSTYSFSDVDNWKTNTEANCQRFTLIISPSPIGSDYSNKVCIISDKLPGVKWNQSWNTVNTISCNGDSITVQLPLGTTIEQFKELMRGSKIVYRIKSSIKTVPLTIQDQDGNTVPHLQAFSETTHISTSSTGLIPNVVIPATVSYPSIIKPSTLYTVKLKRSVASGSLMINVGGTEQAVTSDCFTLTTPATLTSQDVIFSGKGNVISEVTVVEGDQTAKEYGYFEGMQSVKVDKVVTTGKNLFNIDKCKPNRTIGDNGNEIASGSANHYAYSEFIPIKDVFTMSITSDNGKVPNNMNGIRLRMYDENKKLIASKWFAHASSMVEDKNINRKYSTIITNGAKYLKISFSATGGNSDTTYEAMQTIQIEHGSVATSYEPHQSNTLTINEDLELRKVGDVRDELDAKTGEVTERISEIVLDGSKVYYPGGNSNDNYLEFIVRLNNSKRASVLCDKVFIPSGGHKNNTEYIRVTESGIIGYILKTRLSTPDVDGLKAWLSSNNVTVQYQLSTPITKSIDISTVDQDNQPTQLGTFENVTHVSLEAENLIPEVEMEVATNLLEDTVFNLTNAFNTLYPTAAKPVVDGTLYGQTLVNISPLSGEITIKPNSIQFIESSFIQQNKTFTFMFNCTSTPSTGSIELRQVFGDTALKIENINVTKGYNKFKVTTVNKELNKFRFKNDSTSETDFVFNNLLIIEGDYTNIDIPYFEGMQSVKMPVLTTIGKNLFHSDIQVFNFDNYIRTGNDLNTGCDTELKPSTTYTLSWNGNNRDGKLSLYSNGVKTNAIDIRWYNSSITFTTSEVENGFSFYTKLSEDSSLSSDMSFNVQLEEGSVATPYEPYKSITLSTPSNLELRKVGEVQDEVNVMTGEVVERIGEIVLDGSENWTLQTQNNWQRYLLTIEDMINIYDFRNPDRTRCDKLVYDKLDVKNSGSYLRVYNRIAIYNNEIVRDVNQFKQWLLQNPITIQYELATPITKSIDISIVNQDGNPTSLRTFDDTTHVLLNSEGLVPTASLTVITKIPSASSASLLMDNISTNQQQLKTTVDEQSNNVDATMIATTEIFEETL